MINKEQYEALISSIISHVGFEKYLEIKKTYFEQLEELNKDICDCDRCMGLDECYCDCDGCNECY